MVKCQKYFKSCLLKTVWVRYHNFLFPLIWEAEDWWLPHSWLFCNIHVVFVSEIAMSVGQLFFSPFLCVFLRRNGIKLVHFFCPEVTSELPSTSPCLKPNKTKSNNKTHQKSDRKTWIFTVFNCQMVPLLWLPGTTRCFYRQQHLSYCDKEGWQRLMNCVLLSRASSQELDSIKRFLEEFWHTIFLGKRIKN